MTFEKHNDIKPKSLDIPRIMKSNIVETSEKKMVTEDLFKKVDRLVSHTIKENRRSDAPLTSNLSLKELAHLMKGADIGQIIQCAVRFETQKFIASPVDYLTEKDLEVLKIGTAIHFESFIIAIDKDTIHEFIVSVIDKSAVAELFGVKEDLLSLENTRYEIISYIEQTIYDSIRAANYLALCMAGGILKVGEYIFDFTAGTVLMFTKPQSAEALYKKDFSGELMEAIDKSYGEEDFLIKVGDVVENVGSVAAFMGLCALAAPETIASIVAILPGAALYFAAESGKNIKNLVSESGELSGEEYFLGCVNGAISVCFLYLLPVLSDILKKYANVAIPKVWDTLVKHGYSEKITRDTIAKIIGSSYVAARGGLQTVLNEAANITNEKLAEVIGFKEEADIDWKHISINVVSGMVLGAASYAIKDMLIGSHWTSIERERMHQETGWSYEVIDAIETFEQYDKIKKVALETGVPPEILEPLITKEMDLDKGLFDYKKEKISQSYINDLKKSSECPSTISDSAIDRNKLIKRPTDETKILRDEFNKNKDMLIAEWEKIHGQEWPTYKEDIYNEYGQLVKKRGWKYDAHHIHPLSLGGTNDASNITPLRSDVHSDHQGVHAFGSPYDKLEKMIKEFMANE